MRAVSFALGMLVIATALGTGAIGQGPPGEPGQPACLPGTALENDNVRIWFQGLKGHVQVHDMSEDDEEGLYRYTTGAVVEEDANGDEIARMKLDRAFPQSSECTIEETDEFVNITMTIDATVRDAQGGDLGEATATFAYNFNKTANGAKFDLHVEDWPWQTDDGLLGYAFTVQSTHNMTAAENGIGFSDSNTSEPKGHIEWAENATAFYENGTEEESEVVANWTQTDGKVDVFLSFMNVTAGYETLEYDPYASMGDWIVVLGRLYSLDGLETVVPLGLYRTVRNLI